MEVSVKTPQGLVAARPTSMDLAVTAVGWVTTVYLRLTLWAALNALVQVVLDPVCVTL